MSVLWKTLEFTLAKAVWSTVVIEPAKTDRRLSSEPLEAAERAFVPEECVFELYITLALGLVSFLYLCIFRRYSQFDPDEGIVLQGAQRLLHGQVLYRDFFSFFTPGSYYFNALLFRVFGNTFLVARTAVAVMGALMAGITYLLARRVCSREVALMVTGLMTVTMLPFRFAVLHNWDSTLLTCVALYCAVRWLERPSPIWAFATGSFVCLTALFEQSKGAGLLLGLSLGLLIVRRGGRAPALLARAHLAAAAFGCAWPMLVTLLYFASQHALGAMFAGWIWPLQHYSGANKVPYGYQNFSEEARRAIFFSGSWGMRIAKILAISPSLWIPVLPLFGVALLPRLVASARHHGSFSKENAHYALVSSTIAGLMLLSVVAVRADIIHFVYLQPVFFLVLAWLLGGNQIRSRIMHWAGSVFGFLAASSLLAMAIVLLVRAAGAPHTVATRRGLMTATEENTVIAKVENSVQPGEEILAYPYAAFFYYATGTFSPSVFEYYQPGMHTRGQALEMLAQFKAEPVRFVLYEPGFGQHIRDSWPNTQARDLVSDPVSDYIAREYRLCCIVDSGQDFHFLFMIRRDLPCPQ